MSTSHSTLTTGLDLEAARAEARAFAQDHALLEALRPYASRGWQGGTLAVPTLHLEDVSRIPFVKDVPGVEEYQHRARVRAYQNDLFVTVTQATQGYEVYCQEELDLGAPTHIVAEPCGNKTAVTQACLEGKTLSELVSKSRRMRGLVIHPYMSIEEAWTLAEKIAVQSKTEVQVIGAPPPITWVANDKALLAELITRVLGPEWLVQTQTHRDADALATSLLKLAKTQQRVGLKRTRCASAMGNIVYDAADLLAAPERVVQMVSEFLERTEWPEGEEVLVVPWLETDLSPSTQWWIPPKEKGEAQLDGIYEQILKGPEKVFVGSRPSAMPQAVNQALAQGGMLLATALQEIGYVGRCSFDYLVEGDPEAEFRVVFVECNGRWGGTSTPMSLLNRLYRGSRPPYRAQDVVFPELIGASFQEVLDKLKPELFSSTTRQGRFILYNVGPLHDHGKFDVISIGQSQEDAEYGITELLPQLLR